MGARYIVETREASMVIIDCGEMVKSRETVGVSVKLKKRDGWSWVGCIRTVKNLSVWGVFFLLLLLFVCLFWYSFQQVSLFQCF